MKIPLSWLKEYIAIDDTIDSLVDKLTFSGLEVEDVETQGGSLEDLYVGEVKDIRPHPDADKLRLCTVSNGIEEFPVVCGASNLTEGMKSAFAPAGATLPGGMKLKKSKIRGQLSMGMLCAEDELGLSESHSGIMEFPIDTPAGTPLTKMLGEPETVFELEVTPNRPDCLCLHGIARDLAAIYHLEITPPEVILNENSENISDYTSVEIDPEANCTRYTARILKNVTIAASPKWMQDRLTACGIRPINNIVDITNYVMLETGQPLHAFDYELLKGGRIVVRPAKPGEKLQTLDGNEHKLAPHHTVIADAEHAVALAGVMGGQDSEIQNTTKTVLLESAYFLPSAVRAAAKQLETHSESSYRFARGVDPNGVDHASQRAAQLIQELAGGELVGGVIDNHPTKQKPWNISCRWERINKIIGIDVDPDTIRGFMHALSLKIVKDEAASFTLEIPTFRQDLTREIDIIEEVARLQGLDQIPVRPPKAIRVVDAEDSLVQAHRQLRNMLVGLGLQEIMNYTLTSESLLDNYSSSLKEKRIVLPHPISQDQSIMRTALLPQMIETIGRNKAHQIDEVAFFELGKTFTLETDENPREELRLSIGLMGPIGRNALDKRRKLEEAEVYSWLKGILEALESSLGINLSIKTSDHDSLEKGRSGSLILNNKEIGSVGLLSHSARKNNRLNDPVALAELSVKPLLKALLKRRLMKSPASFPASSRDIALLIDKAITHEEILAVIKKASSKELEDVQLFDVFESDSLGEQKKSMAYSLTFRSTERTLTDKNINKFDLSIQNALVKNLGAEIRDK